MAGNSNSGRRADPAFVHQLKGDPSKRGKANLAAETEALQLQACAPNPPDWLSAGALAEWERVVPDLLTLGWVHRLDRMQLAAYCEAVADWETFRQRIATENKRMADAGAEAAILGCTEIGMLVSQQDTNVPLFDTTVVHAEKAARLALE